MQSWVPCPIWQKGLEFIDNYPEISKHLERDHSRGTICFCLDCHKRRGDGEVYMRGGRPYELPLLYSAYTINRFDDVYDAR